MKELSDKEIIIKIQIGEINYFSYIVKNYTNIIYNYVKSRLFEKSDVDDIVQNTFLSLYKSISRFNSEKPILPYLFEICKNELKMYYRSHKNTISLNESMVVEDKKENTFEKDTMEDLLQFVSEDQKKTLQLLYEGYSYEEISQKLKKPLNTVRTIIRRARLKIMKIYGKT